MIAWQGVLLVQIFTLMWLPCKILPADECAAGLKKIVQLFSLSLFCLNKIVKQISTNDFIINKKTRIH